jgi:hypothetical protein
MRTSPLNLRRRARRGALALAVSTILVPAGSALAQQGDTPADYPGMPGSPQLAQGDTTYYLPSKSGDSPADYPGMPGNPQTVASHASERSGFDWTSAGVGAGGAGVLIIASLGAAAGASRLRLRTVRS